jgi:hypothetical protein
MFAALTAIWLSTATAGAAADSADADHFRVLYEEGEKLFEQTSYRAAIARFTEADQLRQTPEVAFDLAKCHQRLGLAPLAAYYYRLYMRRSPDAADGLQVAGLVAEILSKAEADGRGLLELESPVGAEVEVNGRTYSDLPTALLLAPGDYDVLARFRNGESHFTASVLTGRAVTLELKPRVEMVPASLPLMSETTTSQDLRPKLHQGSYVVLAAAGAALVAGCVMGVVSSVDRGQLQRYSSTNFAQAASYEQAANTNASAANVLWGTGAAAAIGGGLLYAFTR